MADARAPHASEDGARGARRLQWRPLTCGPHGNEGARCARRWKELVAWDPHVSGSNEPARVGEMGFGPRRGDIWPKRVFFLFSLFF
jgi:hypothetical protein